MRRVRYGVGMSLDGYIANARGGTDWLVSDKTYDSGSFFRTVDTAIMGRITFEVARRQGMRGGYPTTAPASGALAAHTERRTSHRSAHSGVCGALDRR